MVCTNCNRDGPTEERRIRFESRDKGETELELELCDDCRDEILAESWVVEVDAACRPAE